MQPTVFTPEQSARQIYVLERITVVQRVAGFGSCWEWQLKLDKGYGHGRFDGKSMGAYRASWLAFRGPVAPRLHVDHLCRNRSCVNPDHLEPVTQSINSKRAVESNRAPGEHWGRLTMCRKNLHAMEGNNVEETHTKGVIRRRCRACTLNTLRQFHIDHPEKSKEYEARSKAKLEAARAA